MLFSFVTAFGRQPYDSVKLMPLNLEPNLFGNEKQLTKILKEIKNKTSEPLTIRDWLLSRKIYYLFWKTINFKWYSICY